jgi:hypothetical protein
MKNMTRVCFNRCFKPDKFQIDQHCVGACYHKYINVMSRIQQLSKEQGKQSLSEFIIKGYDLNKNYIEEFIFPKGGSLYMNILITLKYFDDKKIYPTTGNNPFKDEIDQN